MKTVIYDSPVFYDHFVQDLNTELETLGWIESQYPICRKGEVKEGTFPEAYYNSGSKKNIKVLPEGNSISFFMINGTISEVEDFHYRIPLSLFVWGDMTKIYPQKKYDYTGELLKDVIGVLKKNSCDDLQIEIEGAFKDFSMIEKILQRETRTFTAFRINFTTTITKC